jgi:hypothetical protein
VGELRRLSEEPPWVYEFDEHVLIMDVARADNGLSEWDIRIFEHLGESRYQLHAEQIEELGVSLRRITATLEPKFTLLEASSDSGEPPTDSSVKAYFTFRRSG